MKERKMMKIKTKICSLILFFFIFSIIGCYNFKDQFIEPDGYTIVYIKQKNRNVYGYVKNEELNAYINGKIVKMTVLYPYKDSDRNQYIIVETSKVQSITIGEYKNIR